MFRHPQLNGLIPGQIGGLSTVFNGDTTALLDALTQFRGDVLLQNIAFFGGGRFVSSSAETSGDEPVGAIRDGGGLSVEIPATATGAKIVWMVDGAAFTLDELTGYATGSEGAAITIGGLPAGGSFYGYLSLSFDDESGYSLTAAWLPAADAAKRRAGHPCIGLVTTDSDSITSIDHSVADVIWSMDFLQRRISVLSATGGTGGGTGSGGPKFGTQLPISETEATDTKSYIDDGNAEQDAKIALLSGAADVMPPPFEILANEVALNRLAISETNPHAIERGEISVVSKQAGHGQDSTPDYTPDTNDPLELPWDATTGVFGP